MMSEGKNSFVSMCIMYLICILYVMYDNMLLFIWVSRIVLVGIYSIQYIYVVIMQLLYTCIRF